MAVGKAEQAEKSVERTGSDWDLIEAVGHRLPACDLSGLEEVPLKGWLKATLCFTSGVFTRDTVKWTKTLQLLMGDLVCTNCSILFGNG
jgi:hypothetical protein